MDNKFLNSVASMIQDKKALKLINAELESHILDKIDYYVEIGYSKEEAEKMATEEMGAPEETAVPLNSLHNKRWYRSRFNIIAIIALIVLVALAVLLSPKYCYVSNLYLIPHFVTMDFISTAIFASYVALLVLAYKKKSKLIALLVAISLLLQALLSYFSCQQFLFVAKTMSTSMPYIDSFEIVQCLFQPMVYALVTICTKSFSGYIESIFSYQYVLNNSATACYIISVALYIFLILCALTVFAVIYMQEHMISCRKIKKALGISAKAVAAVLALNILVMSVSAVISYSSIDNQIAQSSIERRKMIDYVINADLPKDFDETIEDLRANGFDVQPENNSNYEEGLYYTYYSYNNQLALFNWYISAEDIYGEEVINQCNDIVYGITTYNSGDEYALLNQDLYFEKDDFLGFTKGTTLDEFLSSGIYDRAATVQKNESGISFMFMFRPGSEDYNEYYTANLQFEDGVLVSNDVIDYYIDYFDYDTEYYDESEIPDLKNNLNDFMDEIMN